MLRAPIKCLFFIFYFMFLSWHWNSYISYSFTQNYLLNLQCVTHWRHKKRLRNCHRSQGAHSSVGKRVKPIISYETVLHTTVKMARGRFNSDHKFRPQTQTTNSDHKLCKQDWWSVTLSFSHSFQLNPYMLL